MGWTGQYGRKITTKKAREDYVRNEVFDNARVEVLAVDGSKTDTYAAARLKESGDVVAIVVLFETRGGETMMKTMDEGMHPYYYDCPDRIMNLLTEPRDETSKKWREGVREVKEEKAKAELFWKVIARKPRKGSKRFGILVKDGKVYKAPSMNGGTLFTDKAEAEKVAHNVRTGWGLDVQVVK